MKPEYPRDVAVDINTIEVLSSTMTLDISPVKLENYHRNTSNVRMIPGVHHDDLD
ncbi:unnamed protein product [Dovyalis caffra]|uniref:Uncharacterized protein n=1 Tax=Dovyalis caffra TaxID=77055 RepID=A0AAV1RSE3_9ROSI|nr:unnamed protein product [Dovyalis caffra]